MEDYYIAREDLLAGQIYVGVLDTHATKHITFLYTGNWEKCAFITQDSKAFYRSRPCCTADYVRFRMPTREEESWIRSCIEAKKLVKQNEVVTREIINHYPLY